MRRLPGAAILVVLVGCGGDRFGQDSPAGDDLAGAPSSAGSIGTGGAVMPSGGANGGSSSSHEGGDSSSSDAGEASELGGAPTGAGGTSGSGGGSSGSSSGGVPSCLAGWQGSACDSCSNSPATPNSETCAEVLACYIEKGGPANCDYEKPTADAVVKVAHDVLACRCP